MEHLAIAALKSWIEEAARRLGFDLCGIASAELPARDRDQYLRWLENGFAGEMGYMSRTQRRDIRALMPNARAVIGVGMTYHTDYPLSLDCDDSTRGWIARYAWGDDYHDVLRERLEKLVEELRALLGDGFDAKIFVDTGPLLERSVAAAAGLGWIGKNTCLINESTGSWFFLGAILTNLELEPNLPAPDRCGTCTRCLEACPTQALVEPGILDATRCISYYTIEVKGMIPESVRPAMGRHIFGCDICQDVCPWNSKASPTALPEFQPRSLHAGIEVGIDAGSLPASAVNPPLEALAAITEQEFRSIFRDSPVLRPKYRGFLRNVAIAMGNSRDEKFRPSLERLAANSDPIVRDHAEWALRRLPEQPHPASSDGQNYDTL